MNAYESSGLVLLSSYLSGQMLSEGCILFGHLPVDTGRLTLNVPSNTHPTAAALKMSSGHAMTMTMNSYESVGLLPLSAYLVRSDVLGGIHPDQIFIFAT